MARSGEGHELISSSPGERIRPRRAVTAPAGPASVGFHQDAPAVTPNPNAMLDIHLARLSSQHHASAYNRSKRIAQPLVFTPGSADAPTPAPAPSGFGASSPVSDEAAARGIAALHGILDAHEATPIVMRQTSARFTPPTPASTGLVAPLLTPTPSSDMAFAIKTSETHPMNISSIIPADVLPLIATSMFGPAFRTGGSPTRKSPLGVSIAGNADPSSPIRSESPARRGLPDGPYVVAQLSPVPVDLWRICTPGTHALETISTEMSLRGFAPPSSQPFGNFVISSCPGKKVRLQGANVPPIAGGRGGIRRDVRLDLKRAVDSAGARAIICCLDDTELALLGAPWDEYSEVAAELGLVVYRLPILEGYAPSSPAQLDALLARVISRHTLRGETVLCHCRGGVGRAGLVGCCWIAKAGLVELPTSLTDETETVRAVERLVEIMRRRRSVKAIETPAQVQFLLRFVQYLTKASPGTADEYRMRVLPSAA